MPNSTKIVQNHFVLHFCCKILKTWKTILPEFLGDEPNWEKTMFCCSGFFFVSVLHSSLAFLIFLVFFFPIRPSFRKICKIDLAVENRKPNSSAAYKKKQKIRIINLINHTSLIVTLFEFILSMKFWRRSLEMMLYFFLITDLEEEEIRGQCFVGEELKFNLLIFLSIILRK